MEWTDAGIVVAVRRHGETGAIAELLTERHGRHLGLVHGGGGRRMRGLLQPGNEVAATWRARLSEHLGTFRLEPVLARAAAILEDADRLAVLTAASALASSVIPEREPHPRIYFGFRALLDALGAGNDHDLGESVPPALGGAALALWELGLLTELGFGLDLARCAVTGENRDLAYVSPRSGRAVSRAAAAPYRDRLLPLPPFLAGRNGVPRDGWAGEAVALPDVLAGLRLTGHFLERHVLPPHGGRLPAARWRLMDRLTQISLESR